MHAQSSTCQAWWTLLIHDLRNNVSRIFGSLAIRELNFISSCVKDWVRMHCPLESSILFTLSPFNLAGHNPVPYWQLYLSADVLVIRIRVNMVNIRHRQMLSIMIIGIRLKQRHLNVRKVWVSLQSIIDEGLTH